MWFRSPSRHPVDPLETLEIELVSGPAGKFTMGGPASEKGHFADEQPVQVTLTKGFSLGKFGSPDGEWRS